MTGEAGDGGGGGYSPLCIHTERVCLFTSIVVEEGGGSFVWSFLVLFLSCACVCVSRVSLPGRVRVRG